MKDITVKEILSNPEFYKVPASELGLFRLGEGRREFERLAYGSFLLKRELFMFRGRANRIGEEWLNENAPVFFRYSQFVVNQHISSRTAYLLQEVSYLRAALRLNAIIELKKRRPE